MKKLIILAIVFLTTTGAFSQTSKWNANALESGSWNEKTQHWNYGEPFEVHLEITLGKTYISINDEGNKRLFFNSYRGKSNVNTTTDGIKYKSESWNCTDDKLRECAFSVIKYSDGKCLFVILYNDYSFRYHVNPKN